ncbi:hypothetical protein [Marinomonas sp. THO17]|uniref:hypothetical protein n=1 Tax=Marinomonas sp. THO17 TaxID=3149048 RepID=UPI00336BF214
MNNSTLSVWQKIETVGLSLGLLGVSLLGLSLLGLSLLVFGMDAWWQIPGPVQDHFRGGEPGAILAVLLLLVGWACSALFLVNLCFKRFYFWWLRLLGVMLLLVGMAILGAQSV